jgi:YesN/AraC family two-component response regulator
MPMERLIRVVVVDDNSRTRDGLRALLQGWPGARVVGEATNGREALRVTAEMQPDVVLMDIRMPEMDGLRATGVIKRRWPQVRVVLLTLYADLRQEAGTAGADAFLIKGCPSEELFAAIAASACPVA